jgi:hypothetical protein
MSENLLSSRSYKNHVTVDNVFCASLSVCVCVCDLFLIVYLRVYSQEFLYPHCGFLGYDTSTLNLAALYRFTI